jgi:hypothetical protein
MKMVTKVFQKPESATENEIEDRVNEQLRGTFIFFIDHRECKVKEQPRMTLASCITPYYLVAAMQWDFSTTFAISLPAEYWK